MVIAIALFGMVCWGIAPIFLKIGLNNINPLYALVFRTIIAAGLVSGWMLLSGSYNHVKSIPFTACLLLTCEAILATLIGDLAYYAAIKKGDVSVVTVIMASSPLVTMACAHIFLGEHITFIRIAGASLIILGIFLIV
ncbi:MAG TPA: EamA family transporter [Syntrophomonadaceae bacterium]|nr:EamA family transporter [Syntrophomonadaceae bacterium]